jgi:hypothetical protein
MQQDFDVKMHKDFDVKKQQQDFDVKKKQQDFDVKNNHKILMLK